MVYAEFGGANRVYYGEFENREYDIFQIKIRSAALKTSCHLHTKGEQFESFENFAVNFC